MNRRCITLLFVGMIPKVEVPNTDLETISKKVNYPKEYGLKKLGVKKYKGW